MARDLHESMFAFPWAVLAAAAVWALRAEELFARAQVLF